MSEIASRLRRGLEPFGYGRQTAPASPGLYSFWLRGTCLYVGQSADLQRRIREHSVAEANDRLAAFFRAYAGEIEISTARTDGSLLELEAEAIRELRPLANATGGGP